MKKTTALITGGAGFLGSHLCEYFINKGHHVICVDNLLTGSRANLAHLDKKKLEFIKHDITKPLKIAGKIDYVLHFASPASPVDYSQHPIKTAKVGSLGTHNALGISKLKRARFIFASTSEIYGDPAVHPQVEEYWGNVNSIGPRSMYDEAKRFSEALTMAYQRFHKIDTRIVRIFNTYGERMQINDGRVVPNFIYQALKGRDITVYGNGNQTRSFCYVSDLVEGIYRLLMSDYTLPVNIGNPVENTILDFAKVIIKMTGTKSRIIYKPIPVDDPKQRCPDITKAKTLLHWEPKLALAEGITRTIEYFKTKIK